MILDAGPPPPAACATLRAREDVEDYVAEGKPFAGEGLTPESAKRGVFVCRPMPGGGAWAVRLDPETKHPVGTRASVLHLARNGSVVRRAVSLAVIKTPIETDMERVGPVLFDYDGDGDSEFFVHFSTGALETLQIASIFVTYKHGKIEDVATGTKDDVWSLEDLDNDGRPDLHVARVLGWSKMCTSSEWPIRVSYVLHSLPNGTFASDDDLTRAKWRETCPDASAGGHNDSLICARVWGRTKASLAPAVAKACQPAPKGSCNEACDLARLEAAFLPPVVLF